MTVKQTIFWKFRPDLDYMTKAEQMAFKHLRRGVISWFRTGKCKVCGAEIPGNKIYCSIECAQLKEADENG